MPATIMRCGRTFRLARTHPAHAQSSGSETSSRSRSLVGYTIDMHESEFSEATTVGLGAAQRRLKRPTPTRRHEEAVLKEIVELADHHDRSIRTALRLDVAPEDAILRQASLGNYNLIVMGVGRPAGETLFFGRVAAAVLENSDRSLLFVSS